MDIFKKLFETDDKDCAIGLCKFSEGFFNSDKQKENVKKRISKDTTLSELLKKNY